MSLDSQKCFTYLVDNIPIWITTLSEISKKVEDRQDEVSKVPVPVTPTKMKEKTGSMESIKPNDIDENDIPSLIPDRSTTPNNDETRDVAPGSAALRHQQAFLAKRKRKTASVLSGHMSGPLKYRTKSMVIVYYDSDVQKAFENLVRNIGTGRNLLRKGKMAARMEALAKDTMNEDEDDDDPQLSKLDYRPTFRASQFRSTRSTGLGGGLLDNGRVTERFETADKALEKAQSLCERGAHQFLRDGDCRTELSGTKERFEEVLKSAEGEVARFKQEQEEITQPSEPEPVIHNTIEPVNSTKAGLIEVDDDDDDDIPLPSIRLTSRRYQ